MENLENNLLRCCFCQQVLVGFQQMKKHKLALHMKELEQKRQNKKKAKYSENNIPEEIPPVNNITESNIPFEEQQNIDNESTQPLPQLDLQETQDINEEDNTGLSEDPAGAIPVLKSALAFSEIPPIDIDEDDDIPPVIDKWETGSEGSGSSNDTIVVPPLPSTASITMEKCLFHTNYPCCCVDDSRYESLRYYVKERIIFCSPDKGSKEDDGAITNYKENDDLLSQLPEGSKEDFTQTYVNNLHSTPEQPRTTIFPTGIPTSKRKQSTETQVKDTQINVPPKQSKLVDNYSVTSHIAPESIKLKISFPSNPSAKIKSRKTLRSFKCSIQACKFRNRSRTKWMKHTENHIKEIETNGKALESIYNGHIERYSGIRQMNLHSNSASYFRCTHCPPPGELFSTRLHLENHLLSAVATGDDLYCWECNGWHERLVHGFLKHEAEVHGMDKVIF